MGEQADAVRPGNALNSRACGNRRLHHVQLSQHCRGAKRRRRALLDKKRRDLAVAGMRHRSQGGFLVAEPPIPGGFGERGPGEHQFLHPFQITVGHADDVQYHVLFLLRKGDRNFRSGVECASAEGAACRNRRRTRVFVMGVGASMATCVQWRK